MDNLENNIHIYHEFKENTKHFVELQNSFLFDVLGKNQETIFGKEHNFSNIKIYDEYIKNVPVSDYEDYRNNIEKQIEHNCEDVYFKGKTLFYIMSTGTTANAKLFPYSRNSLFLYNKYSSKYSNALIDLSCDQNEKGKGICIMQSIDEIPSTNNKKSIYQISDLYSKIMTMENWDNLFVNPKESVFISEGLDVLYLQSRFSLCNADSVTNILTSYSTYLRDFLDYIYVNWKTLVKDIRLGTISDSVLISKENKSKMLRKIVPMPDIADKLEKIFSLDINKQFAPKVWPKLKYIVANASGNYGIVADKIIDKYIGKEIMWYRRGIQSSEAVLTVPIEMNNATSALIPDSCFYEFKDVNTNKIVRANEAIIGNEYEIIITTQNGLYRYNMNDVCKVVDFYNETPIIEFICRANAAVDFYSEKLSEEIIIQCLIEATNTLGITIIDGALYPDYNTNTYIYLIEKCSNVLDDSIELAEMLTKLLMQKNIDIKRFVKKGLIKPVLVKYVEKGTFAEWNKLIKEKSKKYGQQKMPTIIKEGEQKEFFFSRIIK